MKTQIINPQIKNNQRLVKLSAVPELVELKVFIDYLDRKYQVDSSDGYNTFGHVELDRYLISYFYMGLLFYGKKPASPSVLTNRSLLTYQRNKWKKNTPSQQERLLGGYCA